MFTKEQLAAAKAKADGWVNEVQAAWDQALIDADELHAQSKAKKPKKVRVCACVCICV